MARGLPSLKMAQTIKNHMYACIEFDLIKPTFSFIGTRIGNKFVGWVDPMSRINGVEEPLQLPQFGDSAPPVLQAPPACQDNTPIIPII